jgi:hypothetical protein
MTLYEAIGNRLAREQLQKRSIIYSYCGRAQVTRFFPTGKPYESQRTGMDSELNPQQPTMFVPWGKVLCPEGVVGGEQAYCSEATILRALKSIPSQFIYDVLHMIFYTVAAIPSLIVGAGYLLYSSFIETDEAQQREQKRFAQETCFGNAVLAPYFAASVVVDFLREFSALFSRTYATAMQTSEERSNPAFAMG